MFRPKDAEPQASLWIVTSELPTTPVHGFYDRLDRALAKAGFGDTVRALCAPCYEADTSRGGRPGIDPEVYFTMQMIGFFENLASERAIAARCADSLSIRAFLRYALIGCTPDHSTLTVIRQRLTPAIDQEVFALVLQALKRHHLLKGKRLAIDASVLDANASLRSLEHRLTGEAYGAYIERLAPAAGVDPADAAAVRRFDRKRPGRTTSNDEWQNPHDPDATVGRTKRGTTRMVSKPEHVVDLDAGAIVDADVRPGDEHDTAALAERVLDIEARLNTALGEPPQAAHVEILVVDKGCYKVAELVALQEMGIRAAERTVRSPSGRALMRRRGELVERSFAHVLDCGGARRTTLRGREKIGKRYLVQAMCANLSLLLRPRFGIGTPKQALAASHAVLTTLRASFHEFTTSCAHDLRRGLFPTAQIA